MIYKTATLLKIAKVATTLDEFKEVTELPENIVEDKKANFVYAWCRAVTADEANGNCFIGNTKITLATGEQKNIEDIKLGDLVITAKGNIKPVSQLFSKKYSGELMSINIVGLPENIVCTPEHPIFSDDKFYSANKSIYKKLWRAGKKFKFSRSLSIDSDNLSYIEAKDLTPKYKVVSPINLNSSGFSDIFALDSIARFIGYYLSEGCTGKKNEIIFSVNRFTDKALIEDIQKIANRFGKQFRKPQIGKKTDKVVYYVITWKEMYDFLLKYTYKLSQHKRLSSEFYVMPESWKLNILAGYLSGDGCLSNIKSSGTYGISASTASLSLALSLQRLAATVDIFLGVYKCKQGLGGFGEGNDIYAVSINSKDSSKVINLIPRFIEKKNKLNLIENIESSRKCIISKQYLYYNIHSIDKLIAQDTVVYNLEVADDHSYIANGIAVHNCDMFPREEIEKAYKTFEGRNMFLDHKTDSVEKAVGKVVAAKLMHDDSSGRYYVGCLIKVCRDTHPKIAANLEAGIIDSVSMGASVEQCECNICGCKASEPGAFCQHLRTLGKLDVASGKRHTSINHGITFTELSFVSVPADYTAKIKKIFEKASTINKTANINNSRNYAIKLVYAESEVAEIAKHAAVFMHLNSTGTAMPYFIKSASAVYNYELGNSLTLEITTIADLSEVINDINTIIG